MRSDTSNMNPKLKAVVAMVLAVLAGAILLYELGVAPRGSPKPAAVPALPTTTPVAANHVLPPSLPAAPLPKAAPAVSPASPPPTPTATGNDTVDLQNEANDIAALLRAGDIQTFADRYAPADKRDVVTQHYEHLLAEPYGLGPQRIEMIAQAFATLGSQAPTFPTPDRAKFRDHTIYDLARFPSTTDVSRLPAYYQMPIPINFVRVNGQWQVDIDTLGLLEDVVHNVPVDHSATY
jgi:hypothetical protein